MATAIQFDFVNNAKADQEAKLFRPHQPFTRGDLAHALNQYVTRSEQVHSPKGL